MLSRMCEVCAEAKERSAHLPMISHWQNAALLFSVALLAGRHLDSNNGARNAKDFAKFLTTSCVWTKQHLLSRHKISRQKTFCLWSSGELSGKECLQGASRQSNGPGQRAQKMLK